MPVNTDSFKSDTDGQKHSIKMRPSGTSTKPGYVSRVVMRTDGNQFHKDEDMVNAENVEKCREEFFPTSLLSDEGITDRHFVLLIPVEAASHKDFKVNAQDFVDGLVACA